MSNPMILTFQLDQQDREDGLHLNDSWSLDLRFKLEDHTHFMIIDTQK